MKCSLGRTILWLVVLRSCARKCLVWDAGLRVPLRSDTQSTPLGSQRRCKCSFGLVRVNRLGVKPRGTRPAPPVDLISVPLSLGHNPPCPVSLVAVGSCPERCLSFDDNCQSGSTAAAVGGLWDGSREDARDRAYDCRCLVDEKPVPDTPRTECTGCQCLNDSCQSQTHLTPSEDWFIHWLR
jgi:hypothetical protein